MIELFRAIRSTIIFWLITAIIYPVFMLLIGQAIFPFQAGGSLLKNTEGKVIGSALIGQQFTDDRYFWSRPSVVDYSMGEKVSKTGISGASNLAPSNPELTKKIEEKTENLKTINLEPTADMIYTSASGLDPHISLEAARNQIARVAKARVLDINEVEIMISKSIEGRFLGIFGEPGVNVLKLNLSLDEYNQNKKSS